MWLRKKMAANININLKNHIAFNSLQALDVPFFSAKNTIHRKII